MSRVAAIVLAGFVVVAAGKTDAEEPRKVWAKFLKGEWMVENESPNQKKGIQVFEFSPDLEASTLKRTNEDGSSAISIGFWHPKRKALLVNGFSSNGNYWHIEYTEITNGTMEGTVQGSFAGGYSGTISVKKTEKDNYEWHVKAKTAKGEALEMLGKAKRK